MIGKSIAGRKTDEPPTNKPSLKRHLTFQFHPEDGTRYQTANASSYGNLRIFHWELLYRSSSLYRIVLYRIVCSFQEKKMPQRPSFSDFDVGSLHSDVQTKIFCLVNSSFKKGGQLELFINSLSLMNARKFLFEFSAEFKN